MHPVHDYQVDYQIRVLKPDEYRAAADTFAGTIHRRPLPDEYWEKTRHTFEDGRVFGALAGDAVVGTVQSHASRVAVPGGVVPMGMITRVGVRADHTRRGLASGLMRTMLESVPEPLVTLRASEALIYGRFGFGVASRHRTVVVDRHQARIVGSAPEGGRVRLLDVTEAVDVLPGIYDRIAPRRVGTLARPSASWATLPARAAEVQGPALVAVHTGADGVDDGFAGYYVDHVHDGSTTLHVHDLHAATDASWAGLWRFLTGVDLVDRIRARGRPVDEPLEFLFTDYRAVETSAVSDETWLRITDVPAALAGRAYGDADPVVIRVADPMVPANEGSYRIGPDGAERVEARPDLELDVSALACTYFGDVPFSTLARVGRVSVADAAAVARADRLFASAEVPWCGTFF